MVIDTILGTVGGLGLFLYGMTQMSGGLKKVAGQRLKSVLRSMTQKRMIGFLVGAGVTALIQSSSATTVMVVGFVNASLLTLRQAIPVIIGTNVGTTATAWLVSISGLETFRITTYALPAVGVGFGLQVFGKTRTVKDLGQILVGFGILFIGIDFMKVTFKPLEATQNVQRALIWFGSYPLLAVLAGTVITMLLQSSSASIAMIQMLAVSGAFGRDWNQVLLIVIPFILGDNIGTTITAQLAALRTNLNARRAAWAHTMFNVIGACIWFWFIGLLGKLVHTVAPWEFGPTTIAASIAVAHTTIKLLDSAVFLPLSGVLERVVVFINPEKPSDVEARPVFLEEHLLNTPEIAIDQARREIVRMEHFAKKAVNQAIEGLDQDDRKKLELALQTEDAIDNFQYEITSYLAALSTKELSEELSVELPVLLHTVNDLERVGDHAVNIAEIAERKIGQKISFSDPAQIEGVQLKSEVNQMFDYVSTALENNNTEAAQSALTNEQNLNRMQMDFRRSHVQRMTDGACTPEAGLIFIDLVDNIEKIGDHLTNIAQAVIGGLQWDGVETKTPAGD
ncbi:MAG TPA: Na/Pi cotransporter family protein [Sedimentisphaerales bacterium]|nr:Na/Pi cotransporter family protein [Sedimentisphaerales bacterium]